jgi:hypothetical protein
LLAIAGGATTHTTTIELSVQSLMRACYMHGAPVLQPYTSLAVSVTSAHFGVDPAAQSQLDETH